MSDVVVLTKESEEEYHWERAEFWKAPVPVEVIQQDCPKSLVARVAFLLVFRQPADSPE